MTIRMFRSDDGKTADIHPDEVEHMKLHGWRAVKGSQDAAKAVEPAQVATEAKIAPPPAAGLSVVKGARGLFFVKDGDGKNASKGFDTEAEALAELERMKAA